MKKIVFGEKSDHFDYKTRKGVYAIIFNRENDKVMTLQNGKGHYFLPGGGIEESESHSECLERELLEETGYEIVIGSYIGNASKYVLSSQNEPLLSDGYFYFADLLDKVQAPIEEDHYINWMDIESSKNHLRHAHHVWAVVEGLKRK